MRSPETYLCVIQSNGTAAPRVEQLEAEMQSLGSELLADVDPATVIWHIMEPGSIYTAGEATDAAIVVRSADPAMTLPERETFLRHLHDRWRTVTGCGDDDLVLTLQPRTDEP